MKRVLLLIATNIAVLLVLSVVVRLLGLDQYLTAQGGSLTGLLAFAAVFGFGGSFISLAMSKWVAKRSMGVRVIERPANEVEQWLVNTVRAHAEQACPRWASSTRPSPMPSPPAHGVMRRWSQ
jgi:heat shock protein HtpX